MMPGSTLSLTAAVHAQLRQHLFPGDGQEAAAVIVCTRTPGPRFRLLARDIVLVPHSECHRRSEWSLTWPGSYIEQAIDLAEPEQLSLVLVHSHPNGYAEFSDIDDDSDRAVIPSIFEACGRVHGSAIMLPGGAMIGRHYQRDGSVSPIDMISVVGDDIKFWWRDNTTSMEQRPLAFTSAMTEELSRLTVCVIGTSGTGSIVAEQLCRLGFGRVILIDHDHVEEKNLNRILNTIKDDAERKAPKVQAFAARANLYRDEPYVFGIEANLLSREAVLAASQADVVFSCVDTHRGRSVADRIAAAFLLPLFDVGVAIPTRAVAQGRAIDEATGRIDYVQPGGATLADRGVYTPASLQAEALAESDPEAHAAQVKAGYIEGLPEQAPAVISLNMRAASACVMEFIARAYPFRHDSNDRYARTQFMLAEGFEEHTAESEFVVGRQPGLARGAREPLLGLPFLSESQETRQ